MNTQFLTKTVSLKVPGIRLWVEGDLWEFIALGTAVALVLLRLGNHSPRQLSFH